MVKSLQNFLILLPVQSDKIYLSHAEGKTVSSHPSPWSSYRFRCLVMCPNPCCLDHHYQNVRGRGN